MTHETTGNDRRRSSEGWRQRLQQFGADETGMQSIEVLLIFATTLVPCFYAILLMQEVLWEYVEVTSIVLTSPFF